MSLKNALHKGPRLLVPLQVEAMMVDQNLLRIEGGNWARNKAAYNQLASRLEPAFPRSNAVARSSPSYPKTEEPQTGIHLKWTLPAGLRHGIQEEEGAEPVFPRAPDRWVIIRLWLDDKNEIQQKGWVIRSDFLRQPSPHYKGPNYLVEQNGKPVWRQIGDIVALEEWEGETAYTATDLTVIGVEDVTFNAYTINCENVFALHDDLSDLPESLIGEQGLKISYLVAGWYARPETDPLYQSNFNMAELEKSLHRFEFNLGGEVGISRAMETFKRWAGEGSSELCPQLLCHGTMHSINWYGKDNIAKDVSRSGKPQIDRNEAESIPDIIIGNSSFDVLLRFIKMKLEENDVPEEQLKLALDLLYAFDKDLLDEFVQPFGEGLLERNIHQSWFETEPGGFFWEIVLQQEAQTKEEKEAWQKKLDTILPQLRMLNENQWEYDQHLALREVRLRELQTCLYAGKYMQLIDASKAKKWRDKAEVVQGIIQQLDTVLANLKNSLDQTIRTIKNHLDISEPPQPEQDIFGLKQRIQMQYWKPGDPVILIHAAKSSRKGHTESAANCRYSGQTIQGLKQHQTQEAIEPIIPTLPNVDFLPKELPDLLKEFILLNPNFSAYLAPEAADTIARQQTMIWNPEKFEGFDSGQLTRQAGFTGIRPDFKAFQTFTPPWSPLFMDWVVYLFQNGDRKPLDAQSQAREWLENWQLQDDWVREDDAFDFHWDEKMAPPDLDENKDHPYFWTVQGRSLISSEMPQILKNKLRTLNDAPLNPLQKGVVDTVVSILEGFDIITQKLNGLYDYWLQYDIANDLPVALLSEEDQIKNLLKDSHFGIPQGKEELSGGKLYHAYFPLLSGYLLPHYVRVVDDFGIAAYPVSYNEPEPGNLFTPIDAHLIPKARGMNNPQVDNSRMAQLPPRLLQASRITMEWTDADANQGNRPVQQADQNSPVCGWILPNHLDKSLVIFDADGKLQGSLIFFQRRDYKGQLRYFVRKELEPVSGNTGEFDIENKYLRDFVTELLRFNEDPSDNGAALSAFLENIDKTTWVTDPLGPREHQGLSALIGRPFALVRARVGMDMKGYPIRPFLFNEPDDFDPKAVSNPFGLLDVEFPFYVGADNLPNNGLIGYFEESGFDTFYVVENHSSISSRYIQTRQNLTTRLNHDGMKAEERQYRQLTMVLDYRGLVHAVSGLFPVFQLNLPQAYVHDALANMEVTFRTGPFISDPYQLRMPKPGDIRGKLSWIYHSGVNIWKEDQPINENKDAWENEHIESASETAMFSNQRHLLQDGWLKLKEGLREQDNPEK